MLSKTVLQKLNVQLPYMLCLSASVKIKLTSVHDSDSLLIYLWYSCTHWKIIDYKLELVEIIIDSSSPSYTWSALRLLTCSMVHHFETHLSFMHIFDMCYQQNCMPHPTNWIYKLQWKNFCLMKASAYKCHNSGTQGFFHSECFPICERSSLYMN